MKRTLSLLVMAILACESDGGPIDPPGLPEGPVPLVEVSLGFGNVPVEGEVFLSPPAGSRNWRYEIDLDEDGRIDRRGILGLGIGFRYRFETSGVHRIRTSLTGPEERTVQVESLVVANDEGPIRILAAAQVQPVNAEWVSFEGITMSHSGDALFVANYSGGSLHRVDPGTLSVTGVIEDMGYSIEGISVSPKDSFLFATYKYGYKASVGLSSFEIDRFFGERAGSSFFIQALDEQQALMGGGGPLALINMKTGEILNDFRAPGAEFTDTWHFALSPDGAIAAVIVYDGTYSLHIVDVATLQSLRTIPLGRMLSPRTLAFHPQGDRLYAIGYGQDGDALFAVFDRETGETLREVPLGAVFCSGYCVASPAATLLSGRYVAFEWGGGAYFIDTELDLPLYSIPPLGCFCGFSVTASTVEDVFYFLRSDGLVQKVAIED
jgi:WD40 repeat protein